MWIVSRMNNNYILVFHGQRFSVPPTWIVLDILGKNASSFLCLKLSASKAATSFRIFAPGVIKIKDGNFRHMAKVCTVKSYLN